MANTKEQSELGSNLKELRDYFVTLVKEVIAIDHGVDKENTIKSIKSKQSMSGANAWMLICSIMIAAIGLNLDSQAVIIGAMLISPLMSPILGVGLGVAINDRDALYQAIMHFSAAIIIALITSTLYFWLTPLDEFTNEIQARTSPTFLDVLIAIFGGIAGIVSLSRKDVSTTIPGVAIATALMPPLCVTGYGIANGEWHIAYKSFYLFFLNSFFVAFSTYVVLRQMHFPFAKVSSTKERRKNIMYVGAFSILMIVPSFLIFKNIYQEYKEEDKVKKFIELYLADDKIYLDNYTVYQKDDDSKQLLLKVYGDKISKSNIPYYNKVLDSLGLKKMNVEIIPTSEINLEKVKDLETRLSNVGNKLNSQIQELIDERTQRDAVIERMRTQAEYTLTDTLRFKDACNELSIFLPNISVIGIANMQYSNFKDKTTSIPTVVVEWTNPSEKEKSQLVRFLKQEFHLDTLKLVVSD